MLLHTLTHTHTHTHTCPVMHQCVLVALDVWCHCPCFEIALSGVCGRSATVRTLTAVKTSVRVYICLETV